MNKKYTQNVITDKHAETQSVITDKHTEACRKQKQKSVKKL